MSSGEAKKARLGVLFIAGAKFYFMIAGAAIQFVLPRVLETATFGAYMQVKEAISVINNVIITGTVQAVSRFTAQASHDVRAIQRAGFRMHLRVGAPIAIAFAVGAPLIAGFLKDSSKAGPLRLAALIALGYSFYAVFVGTANGLKDFHKQAGLDVIFATLRAGAIVGLSVLGFGVYGAIGGWVGATAAILVVASLVVGMPGKEATDAPPVSLSPMLKFFGGVAFYLLLFNLIMTADTFLLKRLGTTVLSDLGFVGEELTKQADTQNGWYGAVQTIARLSYQAIIAATFVIFPLISRSTFEDDADATKSYIRTTMRYSLIFSALVGSVFAANSYEILDIPFTPEYAAAGANALAALALGNVAFSLLSIIGTILNGAGMTRAAILTAVITLAVAVSGNAILIPRVDPGADALLACAAATSGAMVVGMFVGGVLMHRALGAFMPAFTVIRTGAAAAAAIGVGYVIPFKSVVLTAVEAVVVGGVFLAVLIATRELTKADLAKVTGLRKKR